MAASFCLPNISLHIKRSYISFVSNSTSLETIVAVDGLDTSDKILQVSDYQISCDCENDKEFEKYSTRMNKAYHLVNHYKTQKMVTPLHCFEEIMNIAKKGKVDFIALTGDIANYPSSTSVEIVCTLRESTNIQYIYTGGNHDWHYEGMLRESNVLRKEGSEKRLKPLYKENMLFSSIYHGRDKYGVY